MVSTCSTDRWDLILPWPIANPFAVLARTDMGKYGTTKEITFPYFDLRLFFFVHIKGGIYTDARANMGVFSCSQLYGFVRRFVVLGEINYGLLSGC